MTQLFLYVLKRVMSASWMGCTPSGNAACAKVSGLFWVKYECGQADIEFHTNL